MPETRRKKKERAHKNNSRRRKKHVQRRISSISKRGTAPVDTDGDTANKVAAADGEAGPEERVARVVAVGVR